MVWQGVVVSFGDIYGWNLWGGQWGRWGDMDLVQMQHLYCMIDSQENELGKMVSKRTWYRHKLVETEKKKQEAMEDECVALTLGDRFDSSVLHDMFGGGNSSSPLHIAVRELLPLLTSSISTTVLDAHMAERATTWEEQWCGAADVGVCPDSVASLMTMLQDIRPLVHIFVAPIYAHSVLAWLA